MTRAVLLAMACAIAIASPACRDAAIVPGRPEALCAAACQKRATQCSEDACVRGCGLALDRLVEGEGRNVIACVAASKPSCSAVTWANCAVRIGVHADGGPPAPPPAKDYEADDGTPPPAAKPNDDDLL